MRLDQGVDLRHGGLCVNVGATMGENEESDSADGHEAHVARATSRAEVVEDSDIPVGLAEQVVDEIDADIEANDGYGFTGEVVAPEETAMEEPAAEEPAAEEPAAEPSGEGGWLLVAVL